MAVVQVWGCKKCPYTYESPVRIKGLEHRCKDRRVKPAILVSGTPAKEVPRKPKKVEKVEPEPSPIRKGRVLKRRTNVVR